jgi:transposase
MDIKEAGYKLFLSGASQRDIARILDISENTVSKYAHLGEWEKKRTDSLLFKETAAEGVQHLILYNLKILNLIREKQEQDDLDTLDVKELQSKLTNKGDIDALQKLFSSIKGKELEWGDMVRLFRLFLDELKNTNLKIAKEIQPYIDVFLNNARKQ